MSTQAIVVHRFGGPEVLELQSLPTPKAAPGAEFLLADAARAHQPLASRATQGKLLLQP